MKIKYNTILDFLFCAFIFSISVFPQSIIGKGLQLIFALFTFLIVSKKKLKFNKFHLFELLFCLFVLSQCIFHIAVIEQATKSIFITMLYNLFSSLALFNYVVYRKDLKKISYLYSIITIISLTFLSVFYFDTLLQFRFDTNKVFSIGNFKLFGGHSSTTLSLFSTIPCFFLNLFNDEKNYRRNIFISIVLLLFSIITGTRKTLIIFAFIFIIMIPLKGKNVNFERIFKIIFTFIVIFIPSCFLVMKVPFLYNIIGTRIESAFVYFQNDDANINNIDDSSIRVRERMKKISLELFNEKKYFGWGMDYFKASNQSGLGYYSHNNFLEMLTGGGIIGFIIYYSKYVILLISLIITYLKSQKKYVWFSSIIFLSLMTVIEIWQVTYIYRFILIYQSILLSMIYLQKKYKMFS